MEDSIINRAAEFARKKHQGQVDDIGKDYFEVHVHKVAELISMVTNDPEVIAAAYLHDTIEDTDVTWRELQIRFGQSIADLVKELTHEKHRFKGYIFPHLKSREAKMIKLADKLNNISRMENWSQEKRERYLSKIKF